MGEEEIAFWDVASMVSKELQLMLKDDNY